MEWWSRRRLGVEKQLYVEEKIYPLVIESGQTRSVWRGQRRFVATDVWVSTAALLPEC